MLHSVAISLLVREANREIKRAEFCDLLRWLALWGTRVLFRSVSERAHVAQHVWQGPTQGFRAKCFAKYDHLEHAQLTPRKHEVWTELGSPPLWQAKLRQNVAHAADNCQHGSLMCYDHHVGTRAVHLEFNCPQSAKSDSLLKLVALRQGYFTSCPSLKSSDHAAHAVHSVRCVPDGLAKHVNKDVSAPSAGFCLLSCSQSLLLLISVDDDIKMAG